MTSEVIYGYDSDILVNIPFNYFFRGSYVIFEPAVESTFFPFDKYKKIEQTDQEANRH